ncbi:MAG: dTMP kinase [Planctomycetota bacterium]|jgi:dTMP kinase
MPQWLQHLAGRFIVFDGPDGSGKTTQFARFVRYCRDAGIDVCEVREPGGTTIGEQIRTILLNPDNTEMSLRCETMLYMASRAQLVEERIRPALERRQLVIADRFLSSTIAYQGAAGGMSEPEILAVGNVAVGSIWPDLTIIIDVDERVAARRLHPLLDRMEKKGLEFHRRVRAGFLAQAQAQPRKHLVVDGTTDAESVFAAVLNGVAERFSE